MSTPVVLLAPIPDLTQAFPPYPARSISFISTTEAFNTSLDIRDRKRCVVCNYSLEGSLAYCHILGSNGPRMEDHWQRLKTTGAIPQRAKSHEHEPRNGLMLCMNHYKSFDDLHWFVRFMPTRHQYVFVNISTYPDLAPFHDRPLNLDPDDPRAPFPAAFATHELRARGQYFDMHPMVTNYLLDGGDNDDNDNDDENNGKRDKTVTPTNFKPAQPPNDSNATPTILANIESPIRPCSHIRLSNPLVPVPSSSSPPGPPQHHNLRNHNNHPPHNRKPKARMVVLQPISFDDPATKRFFSRENMISLGFRNWTACEAEADEDAVDQTESSEERHIQGISREDVSSWVLQTDPEFQEN